MNPFFVMALLYLTAAVLALALQAASFVDLLPAVPALNWLRVHLLTIGAMTMVVFGATPKLLAAGLHSWRPSSALAWTQWGLLNLGFLLLLVGMAGNALWLAGIGAGAAFAAVGLLLISLMQLRHRASSRDEWDAWRFSVTAPWFLLVGITMALGLLLGWPAPGGRAGILEAHIHANIWGFLAFIIAGTFLALLPHLVRRPLSHPGWVTPTYWALLVGTMGLISGPWLGVLPITAGGMVIYMVGTVLLLTNLAQTGWRTWSDLSPAVGHLLLGYLWMFAPIVVAPVVILAPDVLPAAQIEATALRGLVLGWVLQMAMGGIPTVFRETLPEAVGSRDCVRDGMDTGSWLSVISVNLGVAITWTSVLVPPGPAGALVVALGMGLVVLGVLPFLGGLWMTYTRWFEFGKGW